MTQKLMAFSGSLTGRITTLLAQAGELAIREKAESISLALLDRAAAAWVSKLSVTLAPRVYEQIRDDIVLGVLPPIRKLTLDALKDRYGLGMTPFGEAHYRLSVNAGHGGGKACLPDCRGVSGAFGGGHRDARRGRDTAPQERLQVC